MTTRIVTNEYERDQAAIWIQNMKPPFTLDAVKGKHRSNQQNRLQRRLINEIAEQKPDETAEEIRGYCKLRFGVPILRAENDLFCEKYDRLIKPRPYEEKLELMMEPMDFPVTRIMTTEQKTRYINALVDHFRAQGFVLTLPNDDGAPIDERKGEAA